jgi:hypothetical protein
MKERRWHNLFCLRPRYERSNAKSSYESYIKDLRINLHPHFALSLNNFFFPVALHVPCSNLIHCELNLHTSLHVNMLRGLPWFRRNGPGAAQAVSWLHLPWTATTDGEKFSRTLTDIMLAFQMFEEIYRVDLTAASYADIDDKAEILHGWTSQRRRRDGTITAHLVNTSTWTAVTRTCRHSYFSRLWVMQEMAAAKTQVFWCQESASIDGYIIRHFVK